MSIDKEARRKAAEAYKNRKRDAGVYRIVNTVTGKFFLFAAPDVHGTQSHFAFCVATNCAPKYPLAADWKKYGVNAFQLEILGTTLQGDDQTDKEFRAELDELCALYDEELGRENRY